MQFNSTVAGTDFQKNRGQGLQTSARTSTWPPGWTLDSMEAFQVVGSLPMETTYLSMGVLISSGQQWENASLPKTGELLVKQAAACPTVKPNLQKECWSPLWEASASGCSLTVLLLASTFLRFAWWQEEHGHHACARTSKQTRPLNSWVGGCPGMEGLRRVLCCWPSVMITLKSCGFTGRVWECCSFPGQHLVPITVNNLSPPSLPNPHPASTFSTFYIKSTSNTFLPFSYFP